MTWRGSRETMRLYDMRLELSDGNAVNPRLAVNNRGYADERVPRGVLRGEHVVEQLQVATYIKQFQVCRIPDQSGCSIPFSLICLYRCGTGNLLALGKSLATLD